MKMLRVLHVGASPLKGLGVMCCLQALALPGYYAQAATIVDNATLNINASTAATDYLIRNNSVLNATGANTQSIRVQAGSTLNMDKSKVVGNNGVAGVTVTSSRGIINQSNISSSQIALVVNRSGLVGGSAVTVADSQIKGEIAGAQVTGLSTLSLINTHVIGAATDGIGVNILGGEVNASAGTHIIGQATGVRIVDDTAKVGTHTLSLDNATVQGVDGSAILVERGTQAIINILNGSTLLAGNNKLLDIQGASTATVAVAGSSLTGNIDIAGGSAGDVSFEQSEMTGNVIAKGASAVNLKVTANSLLTGSVDLAEGSTGNIGFNQSRMAGDVQVTDSTATVAFTNGSSLEGNVNFTGNSRADLRFDQSQMKGDLKIDNLSDTTTVNFTNNSALTGNVDIAGGSNVDLSFDQSQLDGNVQVAGNSTAQMSLNNSTFLGNLNISDDSTANLTLNRSHMTGDVVPDGSNTIESVTLENQSQLTGRLDKVNGVNIKSQSNWTLTGNDNIGAMEMNGGSVTFGAAEATSTYYKFDIGTMSGTTGTFVMKGDFVSGASDMLIVSGESTGNYGLTVAASGLDAVAPEQVVLVRTGTTDGATFALTGKGLVDLGTWSYSLVSRTNTEGGKEWYLDPTTETISPGAQLVRALFNTPVTSWYGEQSSLRTRMGQLRLNGSQSGGWMRTYGSQYNVADGSGMGYQQNQQGLSLGADARVGDSQWLVGVLAGTSKSDLNLDHGTTGTVKSYYVGPYATWLDADTGYYFDGVLKFNRFRNESKVNLSDGTRSKGDYDNWGLGASAEFGRQISFGKGWFFEPFTQVSAVQIQGKRYSLDNDMTADGDTTRSLLGKAGVTVGRNFAIGDESVAQPYFRVAIAHEFAKNNEVKVNDNVFNNDLSGTRGEFGAGVAVAMSEKWQVHGDFDYSNGKNIEKPYGLSLGLRYFW